MEATTANRLPRSSATTNSQVVVVTGAKASVADCVTTTAQLSVSRALRKSVRRLMLSRSKVEAASTRVSLPVASATWLTSWPVWFWLRLLTAVNISPVSTLPPATPYGSAITVPSCATKRAWPVSPTSMLVTSARSASMTRVERTIPIIAPDSSRTGIASKTAVTPALSSNSGSLI